jgi:TctA family transporter
MTLDYRSPLKADIISLCRPAPRIAPILEQSLRQSLIMSDGDCRIFFRRPISRGLLVVAAMLLSLSALARIRQRAGWRMTRSLG